MNRDVDRDADLRGLLELIERGLKLGNGHIGAAIDLFNAAVQARDEADVMELEATTGRWRQRAEAAEAREAALRWALGALVEAQDAVDAWCADEEPADCESCPSEPLQAAIEAARAVLATPAPAGGVWLSRGDCNVLDLVISEWINECADESNDMGPADAEAVLARIREALRQGAGTEGA